TGRLKKNFLPPIFSVDSTLVLWYYMSEDRNKGGDTDDQAGHHGESSRNRSDAERRLHGTDEHGAPAGVAGGQADPGQRPPLDEGRVQPDLRSEEHTSELQSRENLVCRLLLEKKIKES